MILILAIILIVGLGAGISRASFLWGKAIEKQSQLIARVDDMANELHALSERLSASEKRNSPLERNDIETLENAQAVLVGYLYKARIFAEHFNNFQTDYDERLEQLQKILYQDGKKRRY